MKKLFILSFIIVLSCITSKIIYAQGERPHVYIEDPSMVRETSIERELSDAGASVQATPSREKMMDNSQMERPTPPMPPMPPMPPTDQIKTETTESANIPNNFSTDSTKLISMFDKSISYQYIPVGKPDPFRPIFRKRADTQKTSKALTPLQRFDLGQLELTTIIRGKFGYKALVMDPTGKGYIVTSGTLIGNNNGKVSDISGIRLIVDEQVQDRFGNVKNSRRYLEMKGDKK